MDSADVVDVRLGLRHRFNFETWVDCAGSKHAAASCSGDGHLVQSPQELPIIVKHQIREASAQHLARKEAALRKFVCGGGSLHKDAFLIIHSSYSLDGLAADIYTQASPHLLSPHHLHLPALAAATSRCVAARRYCNTLISQRVLMKYVISAVVRAMNQRHASSNSFLWGMLQRAAVRAQYVSMNAASTTVCGYLRKRIVVWEVTRRWRATDVVVRKFRQKQRWLAWRKFVAFMNQIRVLLQRLLPYSRLRSYRQSAALLQR